VNYFGELLAAENGCYPLRGGSKERFDTAESIFALLPKVFLSGTERFGATMKLVVNTLWESGCKRLLRRRPWVRRLGLDRNPCWTCFQTAVVAPAHVGKLKEDEEDYSPHFRFG